MIDAGSLEYAHARIWARHGQRADEALWQRIESARELASMLEIARASTLSGWLEGIGADAPVHAIEIGMRRHWRERVAAVAGWMPPAWRQAVEWCGVLVDLPALQHLAAGAAPLAWMALDQQLQGLVDSSRPASPALRALLDAARGESLRLWPLWQAEWRRRAPPRPGRAAVHERLAPLLQAHAVAFASPQAVDGWSLRRSLQARLSLLLRRELIEPISAFAYLALSALEFERIRGEVLRRAAFPHRMPAS